MLPDLFLAPLCSGLRREEGTPAWLYHLYVIGQLERLKRNAVDHAVYDAPRPSPGIDFDPSPICAICKGACCKHFPGFSYPSDFGKTDEEILANLDLALRSGRYTFDVWQGDVYPGRQLGSIELIRPVVAGLEGRLLDDYDPIRSSPKRVCTFLAPTGCELPREQVPSGCKLLEAKRTMDGKCVDHGDGRRGAAMAWRRFGSDLARIYDRVQFGR